MTTPHLPLALALAVLATSPASAAQFPEGVQPGHEPVRIHTYDAAMQDYVARQPAWQAFVAGEGQGWEARFDEVTQTPHRMWGPGLDLGPMTTEAEVATAAFKFVERHAELFGVQGDLVVRSANEAGDAWYVDLDVLHDGLDVWRSGVTLRIKHGRLTMVGVDTFPNAERISDHSLDPNAAFQAFVDQGPAPISKHDDITVEPLLLGEARSGKTVLRAVWHVTSRTQAPLGAWEGFVDGTTGELVAFFNTVRYLDGTVWAEHDARLGDGTLVVTPLRNAEISDGVEETVTADDGTWSLPGTDPTVLELRGPRVRLVDDLGDVDPNLLGGDETLTAATWDGRQAALTTFTYVQQAQDLAQVIAPEVPWGFEDVRATVNIEGTCNAWFDGTINFLQEGGGCNNTGRLADVIWHEWGHGFHAYSLVSGAYDGSVGEGAADTYAFLLSDDHRIAPHFFQGSNGTLRDVDNNLRYPEDFVGGEQFIHFNGMIFGGSMWDTREALRVTYGEPVATEVTAQLFANLLKGGPTVETSYDEAIFGDDDDGDLGNGTPHRCEIVEGFGAHGLGPLGGFGIDPIHTIPEGSDPGGDIEVIIGVPDPAPECIEITATSGTLHFSVNGGVFETTALDITDREVRAAIPTADLKLGDIVEYWAEIDTGEGGLIYEPPGGDIRPHTMYVGDVLPVYCNDFEADDGGFTHELLAGEADEGADDWQWGTPAGLGGDPAGAFSGNSAWGNDLGGGQFNGQYQNGKQNRLTSPAIDTKHYEGVFLRYMRWLTVEDGAYDLARILADDEEVWRNHSSDQQQGGEHHVDNAWEPHAVRLVKLADDGEITLAWEVSTDRGLTFGGWTIDDVCLFAPATPDNRLGISDFDAARDVAGEVSLSWTNPAHAPVEQIRVVRTRGDWPTGPDDGEVVFESSDIELDAPTTVVDKTGKRNLFYAVYANDGDTWLSWTRPGVNADSVDAPSIDGDESSVGGCACNQPGTPHLGWLLPLLGLVGLRRRR